MSHAVNEKNRYDMPSDRRYDGDHHMWAKPAEDGNGILVGIDSLGLESMGDLAYVVVQPAGTRVRRGESFGTMEAAKMTGDLYSPVSGKILAVNKDVTVRPTAVNDDNYEKGWLALIEPDNWEEESSLLVGGDQLPGWAASETERYRKQGWAR
jgi:glycine cleavage system H protein